MTQSMGKAIARRRVLPEVEQDGFARFILNELDEDDRWSKSTATHATGLEKLIRKVLNDDASGLCDAAPL